MGTEHNDISVGDSVVVKEGVMCPDYEGLSIAGWQGRVAELDEVVNEDEEALEAGSVCIEWDSITLRALPEEYVRQSEVDGLEWGKMWLHADEVELLQLRDRDQDARAMYKEIASRHSHSHLGEEGSRIQEVLAGVDPDDDLGCMQAWCEHLETVVSFPFDAGISEFQERGPLRDGDHVRVLAILDVDDLYGVIVDVKSGRKKCAFPLCDLEVVDKESPNYQPVKDYCIWSANR
ncbi:MAG: hypothetical protein HY318_16960 [Armatimonadetes bacterium]|nr:hypothetical protein [Armatimonadota bacterium]